MAGRGVHAAACRGLAGLPGKRRMSTMSTKAEVVVCGAGLSGIAAAYYLAKQGVTNIKVVTAHAPLTLTSAMSTECYRDFWPTKAMSELNGRSIELMEDRAVLTNNAFDMTQRGYAYFTGEDETRAKLQAVAESLNSPEVPYRLYGDGPGALDVGEYEPIFPGSLPMEHFTDPDATVQPRGIDILAGADATRLAFPVVGENVTAALHARRCGWLSAQQMGMDILNESKAMGVTYVNGQVTAVAAPSGTVETVTIAPSDGSAAYDIATPVFVNAAGPALQAVHKLLPGRDGHATDGGRELDLHNELHAKVIFRDVNGVVPRDSPMMIWADSQTVWDDDGEGVEWIAEAFGETMAAKLLETAPAGVHLRPYGHDSLLLLWDHWHSDVHATEPPELDVQGLIDNEMYPEVCLRGLSKMIPALG